ncbi:hypothetical protein A4D02_20470 [Niastella koreensis]|uniref:Uncharacterized protein n=1 Tax=Niastella koreensis TaxID=354356 RepID=A0ABX3P3S8_9BACT|nr:hypothetical protein [Niastella koreensis]OQP54058.1 hypothetical protein A4D02_20470 [Niastella koreensis]
MAFPSGKSENPEGNRFSRQESSKPSGNSQFLEGFDAQNANWMGKLKNDANELIDCPLHSPH